MRLSVPVVLYRFLQNILTNLVIFSCMLCLMCIHKRRILVSEGILVKGALLMGISTSIFNEAKYNVPEASQMQPKGSNAYI